MKSSKSLVSEHELPHICVVVPMYKAERTISQVVATIPQFVSSIVLVDDCSPDNSYAIASALADPRLHIVRHQKNQGVGAAVLSGYQKALEIGAEIAVKMDSDGQMDPEHLPLLIYPILIEEADYTKGNRFIHSRALTQMPPLRRVGNKALSFLAKIYSGYWNIFDPTNGYTAIHTSLIPALDQSAIAKRFFFETSMLLELSTLRAVVRDVFIPSRYQDEESNLSEYQALFAFPLPLLKGFFRRIWQQYFVRDFGILSIYLISGLILLAFGVSYGSYHWIISSLNNAATPSGTVMLSALSIILGAQLLLQTVVLDIQNQPEHPIYPQLKWSNSINLFKKVFAPKVVNK